MTVFFIHTFDSAVRLWHRPFPTHGLFVCLIPLKTCSKRKGLLSSAHNYSIPKELMLLCLFFQQLRNSELHSSLFCTTLCPLWYELFSISTFPMVFLYLYPFNRMIMDSYLLLCPKRLTFTVLLTTYNF